ncbi:hypothetical protein C9I99_24220 [Photobacterium lutimaris]|uniref:Uncharacterized protein n=1 Tax=Photobacterium lutimaris TaxID=388278 RepID=A0A2T3INB9_9GAMM|nr:hypothetical protein C9I99_24220 [Photobacterium lutimaris]
MGFSFIIQLKNCALEKKCANSWSSFLIAPALKRPGMLKALGPGVFHETTWSAPKGKRDNAHSASIV